MNALRSVSTVRVRYAETDQMGVAWHGYYLAWFEVGRTDLLRRQGVTYKELEAGGLRLPVTRTQMTFLRPALYDDVLEIRPLTGAGDLPPDVLKVIRAAAPTWSAQAWQARDEAGAADVGRRPPQ